VLEEAVEAGPRKEPMESSKKLLLLPLTLALLVGCILLDNGLLCSRNIDIFGIVPPTKDGL